MEIDCTGTLVSKYFGKVFDEVSFSCPNPLARSPDRKLISQYNKKPARYHRSVNEVVKDVKGRVSVSYNNLVNKNNDHTSNPRLNNKDNKPLEQHVENNLLVLDPSSDHSPSDSGMCKTGLYYLGAGVGAVGLGALAAVGLVAVGGAACSLYLVERLLFVDPEYQKELKALEVPNVYRPDINNVMYEYRSPYRY